MSNRRNCSPTRWWALLLGLWPLLGLGVHVLLLVMRARSGHTGRELECEPRQCRGARVKWPGGDVSYRSQRGRHKQPIRHSHRQGKRVCGNSDMASHFLMCGQLSPRRHSGRLRHQAGGLKCLLQLCQLFLTYINREVGPRQVVGLLLIIGPQLFRLHGQQCPFISDSLTVTVQPIC